MPLTADFSVSQPLGEPSIVTVTDTSTGSDGTITARRVYIKDAFGNFIYPIVTGKLKSLRSVA